MKAAVVQADGTIETVQMEAPTPGPGEVLLRVRAASINPVDTHVRGLLQAFGLERGQQVGLGWDVAGEVVAVGEGVTLETGWLVAAVKAGAIDRVIGTLAEFVVIPAGAVALVPEGLELIDAASVPLNSLTAAQGLDLLGPAAGRSVLITGASGAVGGYALVLARKAGFRVTGYARPSDEEFVRSTGAEFCSELPTAAFDAVFDTAVLGAVAQATVRNGGSYSGVTPSNGPVAERGISVDAVEVHGDGERLAGLLAATVTGELVPRVAGTFGFDQVAEVAERVAAGGQRGRWVLVP